MASVTHWLEISVTVDGELAEAVAEVLGRYLPGGVVIESTWIAPDPAGEGHPIGPLRVCGYLPINDELEQKRKAIEEALWYLGRIRPLPELRYKPVHQADWSEAWKEHFRPIAIGQRLLVLPPWLTPPAGDRTPVLVDPGMAFGTGAHPSTQLCLALGEALLRPGDTVIDVGCGTGVLSIAMLKLGAGRALGVDLDPQAIAAARENAILNAVEDRLILAVGSAAEVQSGAFPIQQAALVFANILAPVIIDLLQSGLAQLVAPDGVLIIAGILDAQEEQVVEALRQRQLRVRDRRQIDDWVALVAGAYEVVTASE